MVCFYVIKVKKRMPAQKVLICYAYYESLSSAACLSFFCRHGVFADDDRDYVFCINGENCSVKGDIPSYSNVSVLTRPNLGYDFGAWGSILDSVKVDNYSHFIFLNASVVGPLVPSWGLRRRWFAPFIDMINDHIKWAGTTINDVNPLGTHVQSMVLVTDRIGLAVIMSAGIFALKNEKVDRSTIIAQCEIRSSLVILKSGYGIAALHSLSYGAEYPLLADRPRVGDITTTTYCPQHLPDPMEIIFYKHYLACTMESVKRIIAQIERREAELLKNPFTTTFKRTLISAKRIKETDPWNEHLETLVWLVSLLPIGVYVVRSPSDAVVVALALLGRGEIYRLCEDGGSFPLNYQQQFNLKENIRTLTVSEWKQKGHKMDVNLYVGEGYYDLSELGIGNTSTFATFMRCPLTLHEKDFYADWGKESTKVRLWCSQKYHLDLLLAKKTQ